MAPTGQTTEQLVIALRAALPPDRHEYLPALAALLAAVASGALPADKAGARLAAEPALAALIAALSGTALEANGLGLRFGGDTITVGNIRDSEALAVGRGAVAIKLAMQTEAQAYDVAGLPNPYLGLRAFSYADRASFAGRECEVAATVALLTAPGAARPLLFITGASGSGKSSFAQAGLLPSLETYYQQRHFIVRCAVFRPALWPLAALCDALRQLQLPVDRLNLASVIEQPGTLLQFVQQTIPGEQVNLVVLDQFEELFTQADPVHRDALFAILALLPPFADLRTHIVATMRSDYLPELFEHQMLYEIAKAGVDLRAMDEHALKKAIQRPVQQEPAASGKRFEPALLEQLATDAAGDAANLPLLQVTLTDLWQRGSLRLSAYRNLSAAIRDSAEKTLTSIVVNGHVQPRSPDEQAAMMAIFLDLVKVGLDDDPRHDVRRQRHYDELVGGQPERVRLIDELVSARLLSRSADAHGDQGESLPIDMVDIIHETLLTNWERLRQAVDAQREILQQRARFELALAEWQNHDCDTAYLLQGIRLAEAENLSRQDDIALRTEDARDLLQRSTERVAARQKRELQMERRLRWLFQTVTVLLGVLLIAALVVLLRPTLLRIAAQSPRPLPIANLPVAFEPFEVTNARYKLCVQANRCLAPVERLSTYAEPDHENWPVTGIDALQAAAFCNWIGRRLPKVEEWRVAAVWPPDVDVLTPEHAVLEFQPASEPRPVGSLGTEGLTTDGISDLVGNVWELTSTPWESEDVTWDGQAGTAPLGLITMGGAYNSGPGSLVPLRAAMLRVSTTSRTEDIGFRCVMDTSSAGGAAAPATTGVSRLRH